MNRFWDYDHLSLLIFFIWILRIFPIVAVVKRTLGCSRNRTGLICITYDMPYACVCMFEF